MVQYLSPLGDNYIYKLIAGLYCTLNGTSKIVKRKLNVADSCSSPNSVKSYHYTQATVLKGPLREVETSGLVLGTS